jgi:hypothetical protein
LPEGGSPTARNQHLVAQFINASKTSADIVINESFFLATDFVSRVARLQQGASAAATTLLKTMIDPNTPASVRVRAAECVMNQATKAIEIEDIEARIAALEMRRR